MANATYDNMWQQAMGELSEQLNVEGVEENEDAGQQNSNVISKLNLFLLNIL